MSNLTPFLGLEALEPGDPLSTDGYKFQLLDRYIIDRVLKVGAVTHRHDAHAALADPTVAPTTSTATTGGTIPAGISVQVTYTLIDQDAGETLPVTPVIVAMPAGYQDPVDTPNAVVDYNGGFLLADNYAYAATVTDGLGGETAISPAALVTILPGYVNGETTVSGLTALTNDASGSATGAGWRLWRQQGGGPWYLISSGPASQDSFLDTGQPGDCTVQPPLVGTTQGANTLSVTVPSAGQPAGAVSFNLYASLDGSFTSPALLGTYPITDYDTAQVFTSLPVIDGAPPAVSTCLPGADLITAASISLTWMPPVNTASGLPTTGNSDGDARVTLDTDVIYVWKAATSTWNAATGGGGMVLTSTQEAAAYTLAATDAGTILEVTSATAITVTIPPNSSAPFPVGTVLEVFQYGAGQVTIAAGAGVTLRSYNSLVHTAGQYASIGLRQRAANEWVLTGNLA